MKNTWRNTGLTFVMALLLLGGCASTSGTGGPGELPTSSDQTENQRRAVIRLQLAVGYYAQNQFPTALDELKQALALDPNLADAYGMRGLVYMEMGETRLAEENFQRARSLAPNNPDLAHNYGWFLCQTGREKDSIAYFESALANRNYTSPGKALNNAGACSLKMRDTGNAQRYLDMAFRLDPGNPETNVNMAKLHYAQGDFTRARFYIQRVTKGERISANALWTAIRIERKLGDRLTEASLATQLRRRFPNSPEYAAFVRGAFDE